MTTTRYPFEVSYAEIEANLESFIGIVFSSLQSSFLLLPRGQGFVTYPEFQQAYEVLKRHSAGFSVLSLERVLDAMREDPLVFVVVRSILGFTPPEWAAVTSEESNRLIGQSAARQWDRSFRVDRTPFQSLAPQSQELISTMVSVACELIQTGVGEDVPEDIIHRLDKSDTRSGLSSLRHLANEDVPYAMLLYERFLGRPFASHRDAVSELVGEVMETAVEDQLRDAGITYRKTKRAERLEGFDQAPDFIVPDEFNPAVVIEAKIAEDDGTARDKITRVQHLASISNQLRRSGKNGFQVVACIDGRGIRGTA